MFRIGALLACITALWCALAAGTAGGKIFLETYQICKPPIDAYAIHSLDKEKLTLDIVWKSDRYFRKLLLSPTGRYLALMAVDTPEKLGYPHLSLVTMTPSGKAMRTVCPSVADYSWHPKDDLLAYIQTAESDYSKDHSKSLGVWTYDADTGKTSRLCETGSSLNWAAFDGSVYVLDGPRAEREDEWPKVMRWDSALRKLVLTPYADFFFSPKGRYYYQFGYMAARDRLFLRESNEDITQTYACLTEASTVQFVGWLSESLLSVDMFYKGASGRRLFDCTDGALYGIEGYPITLTDDGTAVIISKKDGTFVKTRLTELPILGTGKTIPPKENE